MARGFVKAWTDWLEKMERLSDASKGRLLTAILVYAKSGEELPLKGNEAILFPVFKAEIDRDNEAYDRLVEARREAGKHGGRPKLEEKQGLFEESKEKQKKQMLFLKSKKSEEEEKEEEKEEDQEERYIYAPAHAGDEPPTEDEVAAYCWEAAPHVNARDFCDYYSKLGWKDGNGAPVRNWKAKVLIWERNWKPPNKNDRIPDFIDEEGAL